MSRNHSYSALTLPVIWQGIVDDCGPRARSPGRYGVGADARPTLMTITGVWGAGLLLSFALNYSQISSVAGQARNLVEHPLYRIIS